MKTHIKDIEAIQASDEVKRSIRALANLPKPKYNLRKYLHRVGSLHLRNTNELEKYLAVYTAWMNYLGEQCIIADAVKTVAESQASQYFSIAVGSSKGSINEKKERARSDESYLKALLVQQEASVIHSAREVSFENCERAYYLVSRILTKRLNIREE